VRCDFAVDQPTQHWSGAVSRVRDQAFGMEIKLLFDPLQHRLCRPDFGLSDRSGRLDIDDHTVICVDQIVVGIAKECWPFACGCPLAGRVGMGRELWLNLTGGTKSGLVQRVEILANRAGSIGRIDV
jgi:hypothetical protein